MVHLPELGIPSRGTAMTNSVGRFLPLFIAVAILSWASAYPVVRIALHDFAPIPLAAVRYAIAAIAAGAGCSGNAQLVCKKLIFRRFWDAVRLASRCTISFLTVAK